MFYWFLKAQRLGLCLHVGIREHKWDLGVGTPCELSGGALYIRFENHVRS